MSILIRAPGFRAALGVEPRRWNDHNGKMVDLIMTRCVFVLVYVLCLVTLLSTNNSLSWPLLPSVHISDGNHLMRKSGKSSLTRGEHMQDLYTTKTPYKKDFHLGCRSPGSSIGRLI